MVTCVIRLRRERTGRESMSRQTMSVTSLGAVACHELRHDWKRTEVAAIYRTPLPELIFRAQSLHRQFHEPDRVQTCQLISIKTGGCPEDCAYCPQSAHYDTGIEASKLMPLQDVVHAAQAAKAQGATCFCMGAAWRSPKPRDIERVTQMVPQVKALGLETGI